MKNKTEAKLLKAKGIIKKVCVWTPFIAIGVGVAFCIGFVAGGGVKVDKAVDDFKNSEIYTEAYTQAYNEVKDSYDNGEITIVELNEKLNEMNSRGYPRKVLDAAGDEAKEYKECLKTGITYMYASIPGGVLTLIGTGLIFPWVLGPEIANKLENSAATDIYTARAMLAKEPPPSKKKKKNGDELEEEQEEEVLPNIEDSCYKE